MAPAALTDDDIHKTIAAVKTHGGVSQAAPHLGLSRLQAEHRIRVGIERGFTSRADLRPKREPKEYARLPQSADECWDVLDRAIGRYRKTEKPPAYRSKKERRIVVAGDLHAPFHNPEAVAKMLADTEGFDQLIINGDLQDFYAISRFTKHEQVSIERELAAVDGLLGTFSAHYPDVLIVDGNHDRPRFEKQLRTLLPIELVHVLEFLTDGNFSAIKALSRRYKNIRFAPIMVGRHKIAWAAQEGDLIVSHAERSSRVPSGVLRVVDEWLTDQHDALGLKPWRVLVQAHTHQIGMFPWRSDKLLVEGGCLCSVHGYQLDSKVFGRGQRLGYVTLTQRDGVTDLSSVRFHWLDPVLRAA